MKVKMIDPPSGWKYGFPKEIPDEIGQPEQKTTIEWLIEQGYPKSLIEEFGNYFPCRHWEMEK